MAGARGPVYLRCPDANDRFPAAVLLSPPATTAANPEAVFEDPPITLASSPTNQYKQSHV